MLWWTLQQLKSKSAKVRRQAALKIAAAPSTATLESLLDAARDSDASVRQSIAIAMGRLGDPQGFPALQHLLVDPDPEVRYAATEALTSVADPRVMGLLVGALKDGDARVRWRSSQALDKMGWQPASPVEVALQAVARGDMEKAAGCGAPAVEALSLASTSAAYNVRVSAVQALGHIGDDRVFKPLLAALKSEDSAVRVAAAEAFGAMGEARAIDALTAALRDRDSRVRCAAIDALSRIRPAPAVEVLAGIVNDPAWDVRRCAVEALGKIKDPRALDAIVTRLTDTDSDVRETAVNSLGQMGGDGCVLPLILTLIDPQSSVRAAAGAALNRVDPGWADSEAARRALPDLKAALKHKEYWVRQSASEVMTKIGEHKVVSLQQTTFTHAVHHKRLAAFEILVETLGDSDRDFRQAAAAALGRIGDPRAHDHLLAVMQDRDGAVRRAAGHAIEALHGRDSLTMPQPDNPVPQHLTSV